MHTADEVVDDAKVRVLAVGLSPAGGLRTRHCNTSAGRSTAKQIVAAQARPTPTSPVTTGMIPTRKGSAWHVGQHLQGMDLHSGRRYWAPARRSVERASPEQQERAH